MGCLVCLVLLGFSGWAAFHRYFWQAFVLFAVACFVFWLIAPQPRDEEEDGGH